MTTDNSRADALTDWTDEDSGSMWRAIEAFERIESGMTQTSADHLFAKTRPRKMTITDAKELTSVHLPALRRLYRKLEGFHVAASPVEQHEAAPIGWQLIVQAINAVDKEAARRGEMYPQTDDEQRIDRKAVRRVIEMIEWYATKGGAVAERLDTWPKTVASITQPETTAPTMYIADTEWPVKQMGIRHPDDPPTILTAAQPAPPVADERQCTCGMAMGHTRTCAAFDESMMRADLLAPAIPVADERAAFDGDSEATRAAFRAYDQKERVSSRTSWQIWRDACAWMARASSPNAAGVEGVTFQARVQPWMLACFGAEIAADRAERNHRFLEEALELVQACGCTASEAHQLVDYTFSRPVGEPTQEVGGVMVTLAALCLANGLDMHAVGETELARVWTKVEQIRAKQAVKPKHSPLPGPSEQLAEVTDSDRIDAERWRATMKNGKPAVYIERTERRVIQHAQSVAFSELDLSSRIGSATSSEMWVKRYVTFAWWARENETRTFIEAVDQIRTGAVQ